jgi:hypothetical protein
MQNTRIEELKARLDSILERLGVDMKELKNLQELRKQTEINKQRRFNDSIKKA